MGSTLSGLSSFDSEDDYEDDDMMPSDDMMDSGSSETEDDMDMEDGRGKISNAVSAISARSYALSHIQLSSNSLII